MKWRLIYCFCPLIPRMKVRLTSVRILCFVAKANYRLMKEWSSKNWVIVWKQTSYFSLTVSYLKHAPKLCETDFFKKTLPPKNSLAPFLPISFQKDPRFSQAIKCVKTSDLVIEYFNFFVCFKESSRGSITHDGYGQELVIAIDGCVFSKRNTIFDMVPIRMTHQTCTEKRLTCHHRVLDFIHLC